MDLKKAIELRHSVRKFTDKPLAPGATSELRQEVDRINKESGLHIQLMVNEPNAFQANSPSYGNFEGCRNYFSMIGPKGRDEDIGYYGEQLVLKAQQLGINSCWVAMSYKKGEAKGEIAPGEKRYVLIALGYGRNQGVQHKEKFIPQVSDYKSGDPEWYRQGIEAALLAPTAMNQQKFKFKRNNDKVKATAGIGFYTHMDLGIVKYHFEIGSGKDHSVWEGSAEQQ